MASCFRQKWHSSRWSDLSAARDIAPVTLGNDTSGGHIIVDHHGQDFLRDSDCDFASRVTGFHIADSLRNAA